MTKKDFELIARALRAARATEALTNVQLYNEGWTNGVDAAASELADALATTNPRFDRARFLEACRSTSA